MTAAVPSLLDYVLHTQDDIIGIPGVVHSGPEVEDALDMVHRVWTKTSNSFPPPKLYETAPN